MRLSYQEVEVVDVFQSYTRTAGYGMQRIVCNVEGNIDFVGQTFGKTMQQCTAAGKVNTTLVDISV